MINQKEFTNWDIQKLTELERLGHFNDTTDVFEILQFIKLDKWRFDKQTKREQFNQTINHIEYNIKEYKKRKDIKIRFNKKVFTSLTKVPKQLISELLNDKMIVKINENYFELNTKIVYCKLCSKDNQEKNYIEGKENYNSREQLREYEIKDHLTNWHYFYKNEYSQDYKKSWRISTLTQKDIDDNISYDKPIHRFKDHNFKVTKLETDKDRIYIEVKCSDCGYEPYVRIDNISKMCEIIE